MNRQLVATEIVTAVKAALEAGESLHNIATSVENRINADDAGGFYGKLAAKYLNRIHKMESAFQAAKRLAAGNYTNWNNAGGGKECEHGYNEGIPCPACDLGKLNEALEEKA